MITIVELLKDPVYKQFFLSVPKINGPFRLYLQLDNDRRWRAKDFSKYSDAFKLFKKLHQEGRVHDAAICSKKQGGQPPMRTVKVRNSYTINSRGEKVQVTRRVVWEPQLDMNDPDFHRWCPYCRRPTAFKYFAKHHALNHLVAKGITIDSEIRRCVICGSSERLIEGPKR